MLISNEQVGVLLNMLRQTNEKEVNCDCCLEQMAEFAETFLAGKSMPDGLREIDQHLQRCLDCRKEFEALKDALNDQMDG